MQSSSGGAPSGDSSPSVSERSPSVESSPMSVKQTLQVQSAPAEATAVASAPVVEPKNPFDQVTTSGGPTGTAMNPSDLVHVSSSSTAGQSAAELLNAPPSPDRSSVGQSSVPASPMEPSGLQTISGPTPVLPNLSPAPSTPVDGKQGTPAAPRSAPNLQVGGRLPETQQQQQRPQTDQRANSAAGAGSAQRTQSASRLQQQSIPPQPVFEDDENTEPSSEANTVEQQAIADSRVAGSFARFVEQTRMRLSSTSSGTPARQDALSDEGDVDSERTVICGYLQKLGRNGKWQTRWFESDGECLSYYKSNKRTKLLATLDLAKVGAIEIDQDDAKGCSFTIQVLGRLYHLRSDSRASCKDWVITLLRVKEARLNQGRVKLVSPADFQTPVDLLDQQSEEVVTPRVVVVANRQRLRAVDESQEWDQLIRFEENDPAAEPEPIDPYDHKRRSTLGTAVLARWTKRRSSLSRLGAKIARWARSLRRYKCTEIEEDSVQLDHHVHPPGHDYSRKARSGSAKPAAKASDEGLSGWIGKEKRHSGRSTGSDEGILETPGEVNPAKPEVAVRTFSTASDDVRMIS